MNRQTFKKVWMWLQNRNLNDKKKKVTKYALMSGASAAVRHFRKNNPYLTESTVGKTLS